MRKFIGYSLLRTSLLLIFYATTSCSDDSVLVMDDVIEDEENLNSSPISNSRSDESITCDFGQRYFDSVTCSKEWELCESLEDRQKLLNIDTETLHKFTEEQITSLCLNYPLWYIYTAYNNPIEGIAIIVSGFDGFSELKSRSGYAQHVLSHYREKNDIRLMALSDKREIMDNVFKSKYIELLILSGSLPEVLNPYYEIELHEIASIPETASVFPTKNQLLNKINHSTEYTDSKSYLWPLVKTPFGSIIEGHYNMEMLKEEIDYFGNLNISKFPNAEILESSSNTYNCHSYAWNMATNDGPICWINYLNSQDMPNVSKYWTDDAYINASSFDDCDLIIYNNGDHSAVKCLDGYVISKWGIGPLMKHKLKDCPYKTSSLKYYKHIKTHGPLSTSYGVGETYVNREDSYYIPGNNIAFNRLTLTLSVASGKGDDAIDDGSAVVTERFHNGFKVKFTKPGLYDMYIIANNADGKKMLEYSFQPIVTP